MAETQPITIDTPLWNRGMKSVETLGDEKLVGRKAIVAATAIGSGTHVYGVYVCKNTRRATARPSTSMSSGWAVGRPPPCSAGSRPGSSTPSWRCRSGSLRWSPRGSYGPSSSSSSTPSRAHGAWTPTSSTRPASWGGHGGADHAHGHRPLDPGLDLRLTDPIHFLRAHRRGGRRVHRRRVGRGGSAISSSRVWGR